MVILNVLMLQPKLKYLAKDAAESAKNAIRVLPQGYAKATPRRKMIALLLGRRAEAVQVGDGPPHGDQEIIVSNFY